MRERNLRYVEQRRQKQEQSLQIDTHSPFRFMKGAEIETPSEYSNNKEGGKTNRSHRSDTKLMPVSPNFASSLKKSKFIEFNNSTSLETNDRTTSTNQTKPIFHLPITKKPQKRLDLTARSSSH